MKKLAILAAVALTAGSMGIASAMAADTTFQSADGNKDGFVTFQEATGMYPQLTQDEFNKADSNADGKLDDAEYAALVGLTAGDTGNGGGSSTASGASSSAM